MSLSPFLGCELVMQTHFTLGNFQILSLCFILIMLITAKDVSILVIVMDFLCFLFLIQLFIRLLPYARYAHSQFYPAIIYKIVFLFLPLYFFCGSCFLCVESMSGLAEQSIPISGLRPRQPKPGLPCVSRALQFTHTQRKTECPASSQSKKGHCA